MKKYTITVEAYDNTSLEAMENIIDTAFNDNFIDCSYNVEENKEDE